MALSFLTRIPVPVRVGGPRELAASVGWFPVAGALVGVLVGAVFALSVGALGPIPAAVLAVSFGLLATGAFHEDGLADTFDALGGGWSREQSLEIMRDSRLGTFGVAALVGSILIRVGLIAGFDGRTALLAIPAAHAVSRAVSVGVMGVSASASPEGLGASYLRHVRRDRVLAAVLVGLALAVVLVGPAVAAVAAATAAIAALVVREWARRQIGGVTGDVLGAVQQFAEIAVLASVVAMAAEGISPW